MRFLREPLLHFVLLGALLFGLFAWLGDDAKEGEDSRRIVIPAGLVENLSLSFARSNERPPSAEELDRLIDD